MLLAACAPQAQQQNALNVPGPDVCTKERLVTKQKGQLTIGVESPYVAPWYIGAHPSSGQGYESALAYEIAKKLGFQRTDVVWVNQSFTEAISPTEKPWDMDINEFTITPERAEVVDFSEPYYNNEQAIVVMTSNARTRDLGTTLNNAQKLRLGAQTDTTSFVTANAVNPASDTDVAVFDKHEDVLLALQNGQIDGMVTDAPTAQLITTQQLTGSRVYARLVPFEQEKVEKFGIVLPKGSSLTPCVSWVIQQLWANKKMEELNDMWLAEVATLPEIKLPRAPK